MAEQAAEQKPEVTVESNVEKATAAINAAKNPVPKDSIVEAPPAEEQPAEIPVAEIPTEVKEDVKQPEAKVEPKLPEAKPEAKKEEPKPEAAAEEFENWEKEIDETFQKEASGKKEDSSSAEEKKPTDQKTETLDPKIKEIASRYGINADTSEEFEKSLQAKLEGQEATPIDLYNQRIGNLKTLADKTVTPDEKLTLAYYTSKYGDEAEAAQQVEDLKAQGDAVLRSRARDIRAEVNGMITNLETNKDSFLRSVDEGKKKLEGEIATYLKANDNINGVSYGSTVEEDLSYIKSRELDKVLSTPQGYAEVARIYKNRNNITKGSTSMSETQKKEIYQKGYTSGVKKMINENHQKLFNKDLGGHKTGEMHKPDAKVTIEGNVEKATAAIKEQIKKRSQR